MKIKIVALILLIALLCVNLCSCVFGEVIKLVNNVWGIIFPNENEGDTNLTFVIPDPNRCTSHKIVPLSPIAPTCQTPGVAGGQVCENCGVVIVPQIELAVTDHIYDGIKDKDCNTCGFVREIKCEHETTQILETKAPTCATTGRTQGEKCVDCGKIIAGYEIIDSVEHSYDDADDDTCNVCSYVRKLACPHQITNKLAKVEPTCTETGLTQGLACGHCGEVLLAQQLIPSISHSEGDWIVDIAPTEEKEGSMHTECTMCHTILKERSLDAISPESNDSISQGLVFTLNNDKNSYTLTDVGTCVDTEIVIPKYYDGKLVTKIGEGAFLNNANIVSVIIPEGVLSIGDGAFRECVALASVTIPSTITSIGEYAFFNCAITSLTLPEEITEIKQYSFYGCDFTTIEIPYGVVSIGNGAFAECTLVEEIVLPSSLEIIGKEAFYNMPLVTSINLPKSVRIIGEKSFNISTPDEAERTISMHNLVSKIGAYAFATNTNIKYKGTKVEWNAILIDPRNFQYNISALDGDFVD